MCWSHAVVANVMDSHLKILFEYDREQLSRYIDKENNAHEISPYKSKCKDFDWRLSIKAGDQIDACDTSQVWYNATVLSDREVKIDPERSIKEIFIGYRIYTPNGEKVDHEGQRYVGWSSRYDEWVSVTNPRIAPFQKMAKKLYMGSSNNLDDPVVDDTNDKVIIDENNEIYAVTRHKECRSIFLVDLANKIGELGGYEAIIERINDQKNWIPIEILSSAVALLGNISPILHRDFAYAYIPRLREAVFKNLLTSPDSNIRNFTKDRIDDITKSFDPLLKRILSIPEKIEILEQLNLEICSICFGSDFLERRLQGLKTIIEMIKSVRYGHSKSLSGATLKKFIESHDIFSKIYGSKGHVQLV